MAQLGARCRGARLKYCDAMSDDDGDRDSDSDYDNTAEQRRLPSRRPLVPPNVMPDDESTTSAGASASSVDEPLSDQSER